MIQRNQSPGQLFYMYMMLERFGDNLTVTTSDISKLTDFLLNTTCLCCCTILSGVPEGTIARISAIRLKAGWRSLLKKSKDGHALATVH